MLTLTALHLILELMMHMYICIYKDVKEINDETIFSALMKRNSNAMMQEIRMCLDGLRMR